MFKTNRTALIASLMTALVLLGAFAAISVASNNAESAAKKKKKPIFTSKQKKELNKLIKAALKNKVGPTGPAGPAVAPASFNASNAADIEIPSAVATQTTVLTKVLPAGKYTINGTVTGTYVTDAYADAAQMLCRLKTDGTTVTDNQDNNTTNIFLLLLSAAKLHVPIEHTLDLPAAATVTVTCSGGYDSPGAGTGLDIEAGDAKFTAIAVGSLG